MTLRKAFVFSHHLARGLAAHYAAIPQVLAVALAGSLTTGRADEHSDIDLCVYSREEVPVEPRRRIGQERGSHVEIDNRFWETGDEWLEREGGMHVDVVFRSADFVTDHLSRLLDRHEAGTGYTTAIWHNVRSSEALFDREGWLAQIKAEANRPYPQELAQAIVARNFPLLRGAIGAYPNQIALAVRRGDMVAVNHRLTGLLASYFDVLFALNRLPHPGEKRLLEVAATLGVVPEHLTTQIEELLSFTPRSLAEVPGRVAALVEELGRLLVRQGELERPHEAP